jgi:hypothetical protein
MAERYIDVTVEGLPAFARTLRLSPGRIRLAEKLFLREAARIVRRWAQENARREGSVAAKAAEDIQTAGPGVIVFGRKPYDMGAEFGSYQYHQFKIWRGKDDSAGYFLWPAIRKFRDTTMAKLWYAEQHSIIHEAFPETKD